MAWHNKRAVHEYLKELTVGSNNKRKDYDTVMSSQVNEDINGLELLNKISWRTAPQKFFDETMRTSSSVTAYINSPRVRAYRQVRLVWCLVGIKRQEYEATIEFKARDQQLELMGALKVLILRDDSAIAWAKRKDALCFVKFVVDLIPTPVLEECVKAIRQRGAKRGEILLEFYQDMLLRIPANELNKLDSYRR